MPGSDERTAGLAAADMRRLIAEMLDLRMRRAYDRFQDYVDPRVVVYCNAWREGIIGPDVWNGAPALFDLFRRTDENYLPLGYEILDMATDGDRAVVRWRGDWRRHGTGKVYTIDAAHFLRWENGLVVEMHEFFDAHCAATPSCVCTPSFESLLTPRPAGLSPEEMARRARLLVGFDGDRPDERLLREWCAPDIVCEFIGDRTRIPYAGRHAGIETMLAIVRAIHVDFDLRPLAVSDMIVEDARIAGRRQVKWRHRGTGRAGVSELADFMRFEDGLIVEFLEFRDTVTLLLMQD